MADIFEIVSTLQNDLRRQGIPYLHHAKRINNNLMITCPYHKNGQEKTPSCGILLADRVGQGATGPKVYKAGTVHCFTCGATHSLDEMISFVHGQADNGTFGKEWLLRNFSILSTEEISFDFDLTLTVPTKAEVPYKQFKRYHEYFAKRGISEAVADAFDLGYDEFHDAVVLPHFDKEGRCIMLIKRSIKEHAYFNTTGASKTASLYGLHMVYRKLGALVDVPYVFVAEGAFDVLRLWQAGYPAVGILQASMSDHQVHLLEKLPFQRIVIATDNDTAGRNIADQLAKRLGKTKEVYRLVYPAGRKDPGEMTDEELENMKVVAYG